MKRASQILLIFLILFILQWSLCYAQASFWAKMYTGSKNFDLDDIRRTADGGYIAVGDVWYGNSSSGIWLIKLDNAGNVQWQKIYSSSDRIWGGFVRQTQDGGYIVAGGYRPSWSQDSKDRDIIVLRLDSQGNILWQKIYGIPDGGDEIHAFELSKDGGYILTIETWRRVSNGTFEYWVYLLKIDDSGNIKWQKAYGIEGDEALTLKPTNDGGYILAGWFSVSGERYSNNHDIILLKLNGNGDIEWQRTYGGAKFDYPSDILQTRDGGYILAGGTTSFGEGDFDIWILKLDAQGNIEWQKVFGGPNYDGVPLILQTEDGGFLVAGNSYSWQNLGIDSYRSLLFKLDASGNIQWQKVLQYGNWTFVDSLELAHDGEFIIAGGIELRRNFDEAAWIAKVDSNGNLGGCFIEKPLDLVVHTTNVTPGSYNVRVWTHDVIIKEVNLTVASADAQAYELCQPGEIKNYTLSVQKAGTGSGFIISDPKGIYCGEDCTEQFSGGTVIKLIAIPSKDSVFSGWGGACAGNNPLCTISLNSDTFVTAQFDVRPFNTYTLFLGIRGNGSVEISELGKSYSSGQCFIPINLPVGQILTLKAVPSENFDHWGYECFSCGNKTTCQITLDRDKVCSAVFKGSGSRVGYPFTDVPPDYWAYQAIMWCRERGIAIGYSDNTFHPDEKISRSVMAVFFIRLLEKTDEPICNGGISCRNTQPYFKDVPSDNNFFRYIQRFKELGITKGCNEEGTLYCPDEPVTRAQMAAFLVRALEGDDPICQGGIPCSQTSPYFQDVPPNHTLFKYIQRLKELGITKGCNAEGTLYCPDRAVTRAEMAVFFWRTWGGGR